MTQEEIDFFSGHVERVFGPELEELKNQMERDMRTMGRVSNRTSQRRTELMARILEDKHKNERL